MRKFDESVRTTLIVFCLLGGTVPAMADSVYLTCTCDTGPPSARRYISVDYAANSVITSDMNVTTPYGTTRNVQISESQIVGRSSVLPGQTATITQSTTRSIA